MEAAFWHQKWKREPDWLSSGRLPTAGCNPGGLPSKRTKPRAGCPVRQVPTTCSGCAVRVIRWMVSSSPGSPLPSFQREQAGVQREARWAPISATGTRICASTRGIFRRPELGRRYRLVCDRAALIALPTAMRRQYATLMSRMVEAGTDPAGDPGVSTRAAATTAVLGGEMEVHPVRT